MWQIIMVLAVIAMMVGPILMLRPTGHDLQETKLRSMARRLGLKISLDTIPVSKKHLSDGLSASTSKDFYPVYLLPWPEFLRIKYDTFPVWTLVYTSYEHPIHFKGRWNWLNPQKITHPWYAFLNRALDDIPQGVVAIVSNDNGVGVYWNEVLNGKDKQQAINDIYHWLNQLVTAYDSTD